MCICRRDLTTETRPERGIDLDLGFGTGLVDLLSSQTGPGLASEGYRSLSIPHGLCRPEGMGSMWKLGSGRPRSRPIRNQDLPKVATQARPNVLSQWLGSVVVVPKPRLSRNKRLDPGKRGNC